VIREGLVVLFRFPQTNQAEGKLRPALVLRKLPGSYHDWLICMISLQLSQEVPAFDDILNYQDSDFVSSGLKAPSVIRISRLAVVAKNMLLGAIGEIDSQRLTRIRGRLSHWLVGT